MAPTNYFGDPTQVRNSAATYRYAADEIERVQQTMQHRLEGARWSGNKANDVKNRVWERGRTIYHRAESLRAQAGHLDNHARWMEDKDRAMRTYEANIRRWMAAHPATNDPAQQGKPNASWIRYLPAPGHPDWQSLHDWLRRYGADV